MTPRETSDPWIGELIALQFELLQATKAWYQGATPGPEIADARQAALRLNHRRYCQLIPRYRTLAEGLGLLDDVPVDTLVNQLMFTDDLFKSYDPSWLTAGDFAAMTDWLATVFVAPIEVQTADLVDIQGWCERLRGSGVFVTYSSGTSGRMSFVPRDPMTWTALRRNSTTYADPNWFAAMGSKRGPFDCLVAGPQGRGLGIQGTARGLAFAATRSHFLFDGELTGDMVLRQAFPQAVAAAEADAYKRAFEFIRGTHEAGRPLLIFGVPFQVRRLCEQVVAQCGRLPLPPESVVVTGGGWKLFAGERISRRRLKELVESAFAIDPTRVVDAYSTVESNCALISCREDCYHVPPLLEPVVLDEALMGSIGVEGSGILGFLDPFALSYPGFLITGDLGQLRHGRCRCGLSGWYLDGEIQRAPGREIRGCGGVLASVTA